MSAPPIVNLANSPRPAPLKSFASSDRFLTENASPATLRPGYVLLGDEAFLYQRCRQVVLAALAPPESRDFSLHDLDLAETSIFDILDRAQTPSLMAPFQVIFVRGLKNLYGRGSKKAEFEAIDAYFRSPNPQAVLLSARDGRVLYQNDAFSFREQYQSTQDLSGSIREDPAAVNRLSRDFAQALIGDMLESF